ncbi:MAG: carbohydrate binding domain-containing protein [Spirochaetales bacterium]|nr:carbohydrate binding domain-containing protein [Spirochaetales bacterium]
MLKKKCFVLLILLVTSGFLLNAQTELLLNGNFSSGAQNWSLGQYGGSSSSSSIEEGEYKILINSSGTEIWNVQMTQNALNLEQGKTYVFSFDAYKGPGSSASLALNVNVSMAYSPWSSYFGAQDNHITLQSAKTHYSFTFTMNGADEENGRVEFNCGLSLGTVFIDNVSLIQAPEGSVLAALPQAIDFGSVEVGTGLLKSVILQNKSTQEIHVSSIESSSVDFEVEQIFPLTLTANEEISLNISYTAVKAGAFAEELIINSDATVNPVLTLAVNGSAYVPGIEISETELHFSATINEVDLKKVILTNSSSSDSVSFSFTSASQWLSVEPESGEIPPESSIECVVSAVESSIGDYDGMLTLVHSAANISSPVNIPLTLNVEPGYEPSSVYITDPESNIQFIRDIADFRAGQRDDVNGGFYTHIDREGNPTGENIKALCGESRIAYTFVRAFMVSGDEAYLELARHALKFLYEHGWNNGWYFVTDLQGNYINHWGHNDWWSFMQHYALVGITAMVEVTGGTVNWNDGAESDLTWLMRGVDSNFNQLWDSRPGYEGYFGYASTDWSNKWTKGFTPTVDGVTTHALLMSMMDDNPVYDQRLVELADNIMDYLVGNMGVSAVGFPEVFDADWNIDYGSNIMDVGHGYKTAWVLQRAYLMNPDHPEYLAAAQALMQDLWDNGAYDKVYGGPFAQMDWQTGEVTSDIKDFWMLEQGLTSGLISYYTASDQSQRNMYMKVADESMNFFMDHMIDPVYGEAYDKVSRDGLSIVNENKGGLFSAGYHSSEMSYYSMLYSSFYYHKRPVDLYYYYETDDKNRSYTLTPVPIEEGLLKILAVTLDGVPYHDFNSNTRTINLAAGVGGKFKVTFGFGELVNYTINALSGNGGAVSPAGNVSVRENGSQTFVFTADTGYQLEDVWVDGLSLGPLGSYTFSNVSADHSIEVFFSQVPSYVISASAGAGGTITPIGSVSVPEGQSAEFIILADPGYVISDVVVDGVSMGALESYTFAALDGEHSIEASFTEIPPVEYAVNSGSTGAYLPFTADQYVSNGTMRSVSSAIDLSGVAPDLAAPVAVYQSERYGNSLYTFTGLVPQADYIVRLHFAELYWTAAGSRLFDVVINNVTVLAGFDIYEVSGARYKAHIEVFSAQADSKGEIIIDFITVKDNATIEGIEIVK